MRTLLKATITEFDVYSRQHTFPTPAYQLLLLNSRAFLSSLMMLLYPLQACTLITTVPAFNHLEPHPGMLIVSHTAPCLL